MGMVCVKKCQGIKTGKKVWKLRATPVISDSTCLRQKKKKKKSRATVGLVPTKVQGQDALVQG